MSIINEALRKTQANFNDLKTKTIAVANDQPSAGHKIWQQPAEQPSPAGTPAAPWIQPATASMPVREVKQSFSKRARWYLIVLAETLTLGLIVWTLFIIQPRLFRSSYQHRTSSPLIEPGPVAARQPAPVIPVPPETRIPASTPAKNNLALKGIVMDQNKMVALIDNGIYEAGDYVDGKRISRITLDKVELLDGDKIIILNVRGQGGR